MSSLVLQASATRSTSTSDNFQASTLGQSATYDQFQGYDDSASVYQAGTMSAGSFANTSYTYHQSGLSTFATDVDATGLAGSQTWTQSTSADVVLGSNPSKSSSSAFAFDTGSGVTTFSNNGNTSTDGPIGEALFKFTAPDNNLVPMAGAAAQAGVVNSTDAGSAGNPGGNAAAPGSQALVPVDLDMEAAAAQPGFAGGPLVINLSPPVNVQHVHGTVLGIDVDGAGLDLAVAVATGRWPFKDSPRKIAEDIARDLRKNEGSMTFGNLAWKANAPAINLAIWIGDQQFKRGLQDTLASADDSGTVALRPDAARPVRFDADGLLPTSGEWTAGSAALYGTYWDGQGHTAQDALSMSAPFVAAGAFIVGGMWMAGTSGLLGATGSAYGAIGGGAFGAALEALGVLVQRFLYARMFSVSHAAWSVGARSRRIQRAPRARQSRSEDVYAARFSVTRGR